jgi:hypothetical protein
MFKRVIQFRAFFQLLCCHFLFLEKKKVTPSESSGQATKIQERNETARSFRRSWIKLYATVASTFVFHACVAENLLCGCLEIKEQLSFTTVAQKLNRSTTPGMGCFIPGCPALLFVQAKSNKK